MNESFFTVILWQARKTGRKSVPAGLIGSPRWGCVCPVPARGIGQLEDFVLFRAVFDGGSEGLRGVHPLAELLPLAIRALTALATRATLATVSAATLATVTALTATFAAALTAVPVLYASFLAYPRSSCFPFHAYQYVHHILYQLIY